MLLLVIAVPLTAAVADDPQPPLTADATLQLSALRWGDVQIDTFSWRRVPGTDNAWRGGGSGLRWDEIALGDIELQCGQGAAGWWNCALGRWRWSAPSGVDYEGRFSFDPRAQRWLAVTSEGFDLEISGQNETLSWQLTVESGDLSRLLPWWPAGLALQPLLWNGAVRLQAQGDKRQARLELSIDAMDFDSQDGRIASGGLSLNLRADAAYQNGYWQWQSSGTVGPGALLWNDLYLDLAQRRAEFELNVGAHPQRGEWFIEHLLWRDLPALELMGHGAWETTAGVRDLTVESLQLSLAELNAAYLSGWLATAALSDLQLTGSASGRLVWQQAMVRDLQLELADLSVLDGRQRFAVEGVNGLLQLADGVTVNAGGAVNPEAVEALAEAPYDSYLGWRRLTVWGIETQASKLHGRLLPNGFELSRNARLPVLDGALRLDRLGVSRRGAAWDLDLAAELEPISMAQLTAVLGWPAFGGVLGGRLPGASYENGVLRLDGALDFSIFSGQVQLRHLALERLFGSLPSLSGNLSASGIDLEALTQAFSFGRITGLLDGEVNGLRLLNWRPVAFDARLASRGRGGRISQRAVDNLSRLGGGGGAALGGIVGALFDEFPYRRLGLSCRLQNNICHMNGVADSADDDAYYLLMGRSLPRITIKGYHRQVNWPLLVNQLRQIVQGGGSPEIR